MNAHGHLALHSAHLAAGQEWSEDAGGWRFLMLSAGQAYWLHRGEVADLGPGDVLLVPPNQPGSVHVSQLAEADLHYFHFHPEAVSGLLTLPDRHFLEALAPRQKPGPCRFPADSDVAREFADLCADKTGPNRLFQRCRLLHLVAAAFGDGVVPNDSCLPRPNGSARQRFDDFFRQAPDTELLNRSLEELASACRCGVRHFSRMFRERFGTSVRAKQTELRMQKARQLLAETDSKIIHVALESGYQHLGLFNFMFKRRFGITPSEWRRQQAPRPQPTRRTMRGLRRVVAVLLALVSVGAASAQLTTNPPAASANTNLTLEVRGYDVQGNTLLPTKVVDEILSSRIGATMTFTDIRTALGQLQMAYRDRGFVSVSVALPQQKLTNGIVRVQVTEGRLAEISVTGNRHFSSNNVLRALPSLRTNTYLNNLVFQQELERANANRDRQIYPVIGPGVDPGTTALNLKVQDRLPLHARVDLNNYSPPGTPDLRLNTSVQYNNLWQLEHQIGGQYSFSPTQYRDVSVLPAFVDNPAVASYSGFYRLPLSLDQSRRAKAGNYGVSDFGYDEATKRFQPPSYGENPELIFFASRSSQDTGFSLTAQSLTPAEIPPSGALQVSDQVFSQTLTVNEDFGFRMNYPLPIPGLFRFTFNAGLDYKYYSSTLTQDRVFQAIVFVPPNPPGFGPPFEEFPSPPTSSTRVIPSKIQYLPFSAGLNASQSGPGGSTIISWNNSFNASGVFQNAGDFQRLTLSPEADGSYYVTTGSLMRDQRLLNWLYLQLRADGQWTTQPLINNEQFGVGGMAGPRGYREGVIYGDRGWRASIEPHTKNYNLGMVDGTLPMLMRFSAFSDWGVAYQMARNRELPAHNYQLWATGFAINTTIGERWDFRFTGGWALRAVPGVEVGDFRAAFSFALQF